MVLLKSAALKEGTKLFLKAFRIQKTKLKKRTFFRKLKTLLMMKSVSELLPSTGAPVFASRKQVAIECRQNPVPERKDVRYMFYFLSWDRIERLLNLICCWDYIQSSLTNTATIFLSLLHQNESNLPPGRSPSVMLFTLRTLVCNCRNLWVCWHTHEHDYVSLWIGQGTEGKKTAENDHSLWDSPFDGQGGRSSGWSSLDFPWGSHNRPCFLWEAEEEGRQGCQSWTCHSAPDL